MVEAMEGIKDGATDEVKDAAGVIEKSNQRSPVLLFLLQVEL